MNNIKIMSNSSNLFKVAIVDDNNSEIDELKKLIEKFELENLCNFEVSVFNDGNQFLGSSMQSFDIVYMDMLMPGLDGIEVSKMLRNISKNVQIIIVSSTPNFAIKGYLVDAVGYILKPVNYFIFKTTTEKAIENLKKEGIEALIVIGGDGSYMGAKKLSEMGINCVGLPGTIDNDIASSDITIGFDTALNTVVEAVDRIRDTMTSHYRCAVIEIMGNNCPDLTIYGAIACDADEVFTIDHPLTDKEALFKKMDEKKKSGQEAYIIMVAEKLLDVEALAKEISSSTLWEARHTILGHIQRGGKPTAMERVNAIRMGAYAVELLDKGIGGVCVGFENNELRYIDIYEALELPRNKHMELYELHDLVNRK